MTREEEFKVEEQRRVDDIIKTEVGIRAAAASDLSESFSIDGISFVEGCSNEGSITVSAGIERLASLVECDLEHESFKNGAYRSTYTYFMYNGIRFEHRDSFRKED